MYILRLHHVILDMLPPLLKEECIADNIRHKQKTIIQFVVDVEVSMVYEISEMSLEQGFISLMAYYLSIQLHTRCKHNDLLVIP